ncbi:MAG TPA: HAMP domain-containing sensor histidine kinase [Gemmatimonadaceae bacterium]|nr:HAMP domain-containing sensor histidine kinase [Gemmatimonadaceae bacterium]
MDRRSMAWRAALAFVLLTLAMLVIVPMLVQQRVSELRDEIANAEPARTLVARLQFYLLRQVTALDETPSTDDVERAGSAAAARADARAAERATIAELTPLVARFGADVVERFVEVRSLVARWHATVDEDELMRGEREGASATQLARQRQLLIDVLRSTTTLDSAIVRATAVWRAQIVSTERSALRFTVALGVLALLAGGVVAALYGQAQRAAAESARRRRQAEAALAESARATEARARLLRGVTHDVKNPLGAAKGYAELLALGVKAPMSPEQAPFVEGIQRSIDGALAIIADLLNVARADSGGLTVRRELTDLATVARAAVEDHRSAAEVAGHSLRLEALAEPLEVHTDPARVRQVLDNLLSNAIKYTPAPGRIVVRAEEVLHGGAPRPGRWTAVRVTDTGPGIPRARRETIFEEFSRLDESAGVEGHGLGLAFARRVARLLGGDVTLAETAGPGATFVLWLPRRDERSEGGGR